MSMKVDFTTPLSDEERAYLDARGRYADIERADQITGTETPESEVGDGTGLQQQPLVTSEARAAERERLLARIREIDGAPAEDESDAEVDPYEVWSMEELKAEIDRRNETRASDSKISKAGGKADLAQRLYADDDTEEVPQP